jgi:hypothetical protein
MFTISPLVMLIALDDERSFLADRRFDLLYLGFDARSRRVDYAFGVQVWAGGPRFWDSPAAPIALTSRPVSASVLWTRKAAASTVYTLTFARFAPGGLAIAELTASSRKIISGLTASSAGQALRGQHRPPSG